VTNNDFQILTEGATSQELLALLAESPTQELANYLLNKAVWEDRLTFSQAVRESALALAKAALEAGASPNFRPEEGGTVLTWASTVAMTQLLLESGARVVDEQDRDTSLHNAAENGDIERIELLLAYDGALVLGRFNEFDQTPLHLAVLRGSLATVRLLLDSGANVNAHNELRIGETPLSDLIWEQGSKVDLELVELLLRRGADPTIPGWMGNTALSRAQERSDADSELVQLLEHYHRTPTPPRARQTPARRWRR
jgi:ankyrin repeat protein